MERTPGRSPISDWAVELMWPHLLATQLHLKSWCGASEQTEPATGGWPAPSKTTPTSICDVLRYGVEACHVHEGIAAPRGHPDPSDEWRGPAAVCLQADGCRRSNVGSIWAAVASLYQVVPHFCVISFIQGPLRGLNSLQTFSLSENVRASADFWLPHRDIQTEEINRCKWSRVSTLNTPESFKCTHKNRKRCHLHTGVSSGTTVKWTPSSKPLNQSQF